MQKVLLTQETIATASITKVGSRATSLPAFRDFCGHNLHTYRPSIWMEGLNATVRHYRISAPSPNGRRAERASQGGKVEEALQGCKGINHKLTPINCARYYSENHNAYTRFRACGYPCWLPCRRRRRQTARSEGRSSSSSAWAALTLHRSTWLTTCCTWVARHHIHGPQRG